MFRTIRWTSAAIVLFACGWYLTAAETTPEAQIAKAQQELKDGNFKDAYELFREVLLDDECPADQLQTYLNQSTQCLQRLNRQSETDELRREMLTVHKNKWQAYQAAAQSIYHDYHYGMIVAGKFHRGGGRSGVWVSSMERDRVEALRWTAEARKTMWKLAISPTSDKKAALARLEQLLIQWGRLGSDAWKLQILTDLSELPDYDEQAYGYGRYGSGFGQRTAGGAPVDAEGNPVYHSLPETYEASISDGQRWRWLMKEIVELTPDAKWEMQMQWANFLWTQFGVQTMGGYIAPRSELSDDPDKHESNPYAVGSLSDDETIAKLATGIKRFSLPDEFNFIKLYREVIEAGKNSHDAAAYEQLAGVYTNRRQFPKAATVWRELIARYELRPEDYRSKQLEQIVKNWGRFEPVGVFAAGESVELPFRFRNAEQVEFTARRLDVEQLLTDVKDYIKKIAQRSQHLDWQKLNIHDIGQRIIHQNETKYIKEQVAAWNVALKPLPEHKDDLLMVTPPLENGGAYLVEASIVGGNKTRIIVWLADLAIVKKPVDGRDMIYVADAATGQAISQANVEFFGYRNEHVEKRTYRTRFSQFAKFTDQNGLIYSDKRLIDANMNWLTIARKGDRFAFHGYLHFSRHGQASVQPSQTKLYVVTDRPVYRPGDSVKLKFWVRTPSYDPDAKEPFLKESLTLEVHNPKGEKLLEKQVTTDQYGGYADELELDDNATLGAYQVLVYRTGVFHGTGSFRVEEYKKPEYEVTVDAPSEPVKLGEQVTANIVAKYYFGAPVTNAKVHYKVTRTPHDSRWYPIQPWDWFYETGYWWFGYDYAWYPGWHKWGCYSPIRSWWNWQADPPEIVMEDDVEIGPDGTVEIKIDTAPALAAHGDQDHKYEVTAEVVDESRRTIVGQGSVLVSRAPFKVFAWPNKGYYLEGDTAEFQFKAQTLDRKPVTGKGIARLFQVAYDQNGDPQETEIETWDLDPTPAGTASLKLATRRAGQYRLSYTVTDDKQNEIEGAYVFLVRGEGFDASEFRFNELELIAEKKQYQPGEKVKLLINTNRTGTTVLLFPRSANGISSTPIVLKMAGKSTVYELDVREGDRPNFFVEALTVFDGKVHMQAREVIVPPAKKIINVAVESAEPEYKPGQDSKLKLKFTTEEGEPFVGSTILAVYDKAVEYISGGSNASDIREFFWKWRRNYHQNYESSLQRYFYALYRNGELQMSNLGVFGGILERLAFDDSDRDVEQNQTMTRRGMPGKGSEGYALGASMEMADAAKMPMAKSVAGTPIGQPGPPGSGDTVEPTVRKNFADTAYWSTEITTDAEGLAEVSFPLPESLTTWKTRVWTMGQAAEVGEGTTEFVTKKNVLVRLQSPRFFTQKDEVVLSANIHNYLAESKQVTAVLELEGGQLTPLDELVRRVEVPAGGETRIDWRVKAVKEGNVTIRVKALTDTESDAMQMEFPVYVHGILKTESFTGVVRTGTESAKVELNVPAERRINQTRLEVRYSPTLAGAMVDALPYLADYPYGCTEQTLNRFLPTVITQNILKRMNLDLKEIKEKRTNLNAQEIGDDVERAQQWKRFTHNPVFDEAEVAKMVDEGVQRLTEMHLSDGGWGWFSGWGEQSYPHTTAVVVHGLQIAQQNGVAIVPDTLQRGVQWLKNHQDAQVELLQNAELPNDERKGKQAKTKANDLDALVFMVLVDADQVDDRMENYLYRDRVDLSLYAKAMFGLSLHKMNSAEKLAMILKNIDQFLVQDEENETAYLNDRTSPWWYWYGSAIEANSFYLKLLSKTDPKGVKASRLVKYLLNNRKHATYWNSTRDTAYAIEALAEYLVASEEISPEMTVEVWLDGKKQKEVEITRENLFTFDNKLELVGDAVESGRHTLELRRKGKGPLYFNAYLTNFTLEDFITKAGLEVKVRRKYYKLIRDDREGKVAGQRGEAVGQKEERYIREELVNFAELTSGDLVEIELEIDSKNDYEYLVFEDRKAAGFEPVTLRSGYIGGGLGAYMELRDEKVAFFVRALPRGEHSVSYRMRAEIPGKFSALPTSGEAMYAPELRANSDEIKLQIVDRE